MDSQTTTYHAQLSYRHPDANGTLGAASVAYSGLTQPPYVYAEQNGIIRVNIGTDQFIFTIHTFIGVQYEEEQHDGTNA